MGTCAAENIERMLLAAKPVLTDENLTSSEIESGIPPKSLQTPRTSRSQDIADS